MFSTTKRETTRTEHIMTNEQNNELQALLAAWRDHQDNKENGAAMAELLHSRERLDIARRDTWSHLALAS